METIICDTNIWYNIADRIIPPNHFVKNNLIITQVVIQELCTSPRTLTKSNLLVETCGAICLFAKEATLYNPYNYLINNYADDTETSKIIYQICDIAQRHSLAKSLLNNDNLLRNSLEKTLKAYFAERQRSTKSFEKFISDFRQKNNLYDKNIIRRSKNIDTLAYRKQLIINFFGYTKEDASRIKWNQHELFLKTFDHWMKELETGAKVYKDNDWEDYLNLIYVLPNMKYWTHEKKWILMIWDSGMGDSLYRDDEVDRILKKNGKLK